MKRDELPKVSIIIPVYNGANYMTQAIDSALSQTYPNLEIIVVNDGSVDKTDHIAKKYGNKIRYYKKSNGGVSSALNLGISKMTGSYFSWLSHDDIYMPNKISAEITFLKEHGLLNKKVIAYSDFCLIDAKNKHIIDVRADHETTTKKPEYALLRGLINGNTLLIPKDAFVTYGDFDTNLSCVQDYQKWFEMQKTYSFIHVPEILVKSRYHAKQVSNTSPAVKTEGNAFWLRLIKGTSTQTKKRLNGSLYAFYYHMAEYLKTSPYDEAYEYCIENLKKFPKEPITADNYRPQNKNQQIYPKNKFISFIRFIKYEGFKNTLKRIHKKIMSKMSKH